MRHNSRFGLFILSALIGLSSTPLSAQTRGDDPWAPLKFLIGNWSGTGLGDPGEAVGSTSFSFELDKKIIIRKNRAEMAPKPGEKQVQVHIDLMVIYRRPSDSKFHAIYFDSEGHVINYTISCPKGESAAYFESEATKQGPRFRLAYRMQKENALSVEFSIAAPGGEFKTYLKGKVKKAS